MKKTIFTIFFLSLILSLSCIIVNADASGVMTHTYNGGIIVNNTWEFVSSEKTLYIRSNAPGAYNETGRDSYDQENNAWAAYKNEIEHVILEGSFAKCSGSAFKGYTALKDIRITEGTNQFDGSCFEGCTNLESITVGNDEHIPGVANLSPASIFRGNKQFYGTKIKTAYITSDVDVTGEKQFNSGITIYAPKNTDIFKYFSESGLYTVKDNSPVEISIVFDGNTYTKLYPFGAEIIFPTVNNDCTVLYRDSEFKEPYISTNATESITLYGKTLLDFVGTMVRSADYHGLRMIYRLDENALSPLLGFEVKEFGALAMKQNGIGEKLTLSSKGSHRSVIYKDGEYEGSLLSIPSGGITEFAYTAVGFEKNNEISIENAQQNLYFRGYVILSNPTTGEEFIGYTDQKKMNLADGCTKTLELNDALIGEMLTSEEKEFVNEPLRSGAVPNYIYTREELLSLINTVYNDEAHYMPAQHLSSGKTSLSTFLNDAYKVSGTYPALVAFDLDGMTTLNEKSLALIEECKEYIEMGGIVSFSYHMENPTGNYTSQGVCRGELGDEDKWIELMTEGTDLNKRFKEILSYAGDILNEFDKEGYPVIWRPFHEHNGGWFWWCAIQTFEENGVSVTRPIAEDVFIDLWRYVYRYYTEELGLKHLVWAYSPNVTNSKTSPVPTTYGYPGDEYCDIAGNDWYTSGNFEVNGSEKCYLSLMELSGKPAALTEFGPTGALKADASKGQTQIELFSCREQLDIVKRMMKEGLKLTYVLNWSSSWSMLVLGNMDVLMQDETALDVFEIKDIFDGLYKQRN